MALAESDPIHDALSRFDRLAPLGDREADSLASDISLLQAAAGEQLLALGSDDTRQLFLIEGELELIAGDGARHRVRDFDPAARSPVSRLRPSRYRVRALTAARYLLVEQRLLDGCEEPAGQPGMLVEESYPVGEISELIDDSATHPIMFDILDDFNHGRIVVPSDPTISARVGAALGAAGDDVERLASVLVLCPVLALKTIRTVMAANQKDPKPVRSVRQAVEMLGAENVYALAANCVLRESLRTTTPRIAERMHEWWQRTQRVAAISAVLARLSERFDPDFASLVGLLHAIAEPVVLGYVGRHRDLSDPVALENVVHDNRGELGRMLTTHWGLPRAVCEAATLCNHWEYDHPGTADYTDISLVAQWHATLGASNRRRRPGAGRIPAFRRLGLDDAAPEVSLRIIEAADNAIERSERLLSPPLDDLGN